LPQTLQQGLCPWTRCHISIHNFTQKRSQRFQSRRLWVGSEGGTGVCSSYPQWGLRTLLSEIFRDLMLRCAFKCISASWRQHFQFLWYQSYTVLASETRGDRTPPNLCLPVAVPAKVLCMLLRKRNYTPSHTLHSTNQLFSTVHDCLLNVVREV